MGRKVTEGTLYDVSAVKSRYDLLPSQLVDLKGLAGDSSDNVPGVSGIGAKTATSLLQQYQDIEGIYAHLPEIEKRWQAKLAEGRDAAFQSKHLVQLVRDVPVELDLQAARVRAYNRQQVVDLFRQLGFFSLLSRLPEQEERKTQLSLLEEVESPYQAASPRTTTGEYYAVDTAAALDALVAELVQASALACDVETTGLDPMQAELVGIALTAWPGRAYYVPVGHAPLKGQNLPLELVRAKLGPILADSRIGKYFHNADFDLMALAEAGFAVEGIAFDTMIAADLIDPGRANLGLKQLAWERLGVEMTPISNLIGKGQITMAQVPVSEVAPYAGADVDMTFRLVEVLRRDLAERHLEPLFQKVELPLIPVLLEMERHGVMLDVAFLNKMSKEFAAQMAELEDRIYAIAGHPFNLNSTRQLGQVLFEELGLTPPKRTATGYSTDASVMDELRGAHPIIDLLAEYRQLSKIKSTYLDALPGLVNPRTGRVHTSYNQTGTVTGRISSRNPNLQNIPIRTEVGREVRQAFIAPEGHWLLEADYSQVELRILAHISGDQELRAAFLRGEDIHANTAASIMGVPLAEVTADMRRVAKSVNFGIIYGISDFGLAQYTGLSQADAARYITNYFARYPRVREYLEETKEKARRDGYVETLLGRRRYFPELQSASRANFNSRRAAERMAINMPIQGTAADIIKLAMIEIAAMLRREGLQSKMIMQVHDELVFEVPDAELDVIRQRVHDVMENIYPLAVPLNADVKVGRDWGHMA